MSEEQDELIVIVSKDGKTWRRFGLWYVPFRGCMSKDNEHLVEQHNKFLENNLSFKKYDYAEYVSKSYFEEFQQPFC